MSAQATLANQANNPVQKMLKGRSSRQAKNAIAAPTTTDFSIMGTNDSSIVSKRSVELLYHAQPHFFHHFVKKPKRRAPLINRGYWLRMRAIEFELAAFLDEETTKRKVVINLGCGYDPLPFQMLSKDVAQKDVLFVDVDYPDLIRNKVSMITASSELVNMLPNLRTPGLNELPLSSDRYVAIGCDLSYPKVLETLLGSFLDMPNCTFCFVAEVSVTYMKEKAADALIQWASGIGDARFIQLEQCLPYGQAHPFAETMLKHFAKLGTRLRSLSSYSTEGKHQNRFIARGWRSARSSSLWQLWANNKFLSIDEKRRLDEVEPFDEWEEFALFASHYFILTASTSTPMEEPVQAEKIACVEHGGDLVEPEADVELSSVRLSDKGQKSAARSFAASLALSPTAVALYGGKGAQTRLRTMEVLSSEGSIPTKEPQSVPPGLGERLCHTITQLYQAEKDYSYLLVGGRTSPDGAISDCWYIESGGCPSQEQLRWHRAASLPHGVYRHAETALYDRAKGSSVGALIFGGKSGRAEISNSWYLWTKENSSESKSSDHIGKWTKLTIEGDNCQPRFGACLITLGNSNTEQEAFSGFLLGGLGQNGVIINESLAWTVDLRRSILKIGKAPEANSPELARFGAILVPCPRLTAKQSPGSGEAEDVYALVGGDLASAVCSQPIARLQVSPTGIRSMPARVYGGFGSLRAPLLVGHAAVSTGQDQILITGGGATCFSFGTYHNGSTWTLNWEDSTGLWQPERDLWSAVKVALDTPVVAPVPLARPSVPGPRAKAIVRIGPNDQEAGNFDKVLAVRQPRVLTGLDLGSCVQKWSLAYLQKAIGPDREVIVHESVDAVMDFQSKNFTYQKVSFGTFVDEIQKGDKKYLRSLSAQSGNTPADFWTDYPELANDFELPKAIDKVIDASEEGTQSRRHSSVFRVSGPVSMWLHYDVMSNVLCQIHGTKRLLLYPPEDVRHLQIAPGQSSSSFNMFDPTTYKKHKLSKLHPHVVDLAPGDILYIPALWLHTAQPKSGTSVAVNVFFRDLDSGYAAGRDVYGNRDVQAYEDGRRDVKRIAGRFARLPPEMRTFYLSQLSRELEDLAEK